MICIMIQNGETFIWIFGFTLKSVGVGVTMLTEIALNEMCERDFEGLGH